MSTSERVVEKLKGLPEFQVQAVLAFVEELSTAPVLSATELMRLPASERRRVLASQARQAEALYRQNRKSPFAQFSWFVHLPIPLLAQQHVRDAVRAERGLPADFGGRLRRCGFTKVLRGVPTWLHHRKNR